MNNTCPLRITATAGTELAGTSYYVAIVMTLLRPVFNKSLQLKNTKQFTS